MKGDLYECVVSHQRLKPLKNSFVHRVFMLSVDLDALPDLAGRTRWLGHNRFNLFSVDDSDHVDMGLPGGIRPNLAAWLSAEGMDLPADASVRLVTFPRVLGYGFNPVSFYYIHRRDGSPLVAVAEVVNTFREMKLYRVGESGGDAMWRRRVAKNFYVSPFSDPGDSFDFRLGIPGDSWRVGIDDLDAEGKVLVSAIRGVRRELTSARLLLCAFKYPLLSLGIIGMIHWHALILWLRRVPYFRKSERPEVQTGVMRGHPAPNQNLP